MWGCQLMILLWLSSGIFRLRGSGIIPAEHRLVTQRQIGVVKQPPLDLSMAIRKSHQALAAPARRRVRGIAAQSIFVAMLLSAANLRKLASLAEKGEATPRRARRRKEDIANYRPS